ncbi:hypothetical protein ACT517_17260 [Pseudomonas aeruginosa]
MDVKSPEAVQEEILTAAMTKLKDEAKAVIDGVMGQLYTDYLPYVITDTEANIGNRVSGCVRNLIAGKFEAHENHAMVSDGYGQNHYVFMSSWSDMVKPLCEAMGDQIKDARIEQLERQVERLKNELAEAWRNR